MNKGVIDDRMSIGATLVRLRAAAISDDEFKLSLLSSQRSFEEQALKLRASLEGQLEAMRKAAEQLHVNVMRREKQLDEVNTEVEVKINQFGDLVQSIPATDAAAAIQKCSSEPAAPNAELKKY